MTKTIVLVNNGGCYSDYGIMGYVIVNKKDVEKVQSVISEASIEYHRLYSEARDMADKDYREKTGCIIKYPVERTVIGEICKKYGMVYVDKYNEVSFEECC